MTAAVLDACVLYPMELRDTLLRVAAAGVYRLHWTTEILDEMSRNLVARGVMPMEPAARLRRQMEAAFPDAMVDDYARHIPEMPNHAKDRHVAAAAVAIGAEVIVTANLKDFAVLPPGVAAMSPDDFLCTRFAADPDSVLEALARQAAARRRPPMDVDTILDRLASSLPVFVAAVRGAIAADERPQPR